MDGLALAALWLARPPRADLVAELRHHGSSLVRTAAVTAGLGGLVFGGGLDRLAVQRLTGSVLSTPEFVGLGPVHPGDIVHHDLTVANNGPADVMVVGGTSDCTCLVSDVPRVVPAGGTATVRLSLRVPTDARGLNQRSMQLWTDLARQPRLWVGVGFDSVAAPVAPPLTSGDSSND